MTVLLVASRADGTNGVNASWTTTANFVAPGTDVWSMIDISYAGSVKTNVSTVSDTQGLTWHQRFAFEFQDDQNVWNVLERWYALAPSGVNGKTTIVNNGALGSPNTQSIVQHAWSGAGVVDPFSNIIPSFNFNKLTATATAVGATMPSITTDGQSLRMDVGLSSAICRQGGFPLQVMEGMTTIQKTGEEPGVGSNRTAIELDWEGLNLGGVTLIMGVSLEAWGVVLDGLAAGVIPPPPQTQGLITC